MLGAAGPELGAGAVTTIGGAGAAAPQAVITLASVQQMIQGVRDMRATISHRCRGQGARASLLSRGTRGTRGTHV